MTTDFEYIHHINSYVIGLERKPNNVYNFRCPFCGDSHKNKSKKRGYFLPKGDVYIFKCHNCGYSCNLAGFIKHFDEDLYKKYCLDSFGEKYGKNKFKKRIVEPVIEKRNVKKLFDVKEVVPISMLPKTHKCIKYLVSRKIPLDKELYFVEDFSVLNGFFKHYDAEKFPKDARLVIPFYDRYGNLIALQGRALGKTKLRYCTIKEDDNKPLIYNLNKVDFNKIILCTEGAVDAMFLKNSVAVAGAEFSKVSSEIPKDKIIILLDNEPRNKQIVNKYEKFCDMGFRVCIFPDLLKGKDINEMLLNGHSLQEIIKHIAKNSFKDLELKLNINKWKKI